MPHKAPPPMMLALLNDPACYDHPVEKVALIETHISWVLLTGEFAYKIKKPVNLGFLDFSTLALRHQDCLEELRLNRRLAADTIWRWWRSPAAWARRASGEQAKLLNML